jgi:hypothetical protein
MGGKVLPLYLDSCPFWIKENINLLDGPFGIYDYGENIKKYNSQNIPPFLGANSTFKRECFLKYGLFRTDIGPGSGAKGGDTEFFRRLEKGNANLYYCGPCVVWHKIIWKEMGLEYLTRWYIKGGRYYARKDDNSKRLICYFGVPRYIFRELGEDIIKLFLSLFLFDMKKLLKTWQGIFINIGMCLEYKRLSRCQK